MNVLFQIIDGFIHLQNYQSFTMKLLSCYQQRTEKIIKSNIAVLFSFHLSAVLIETDANVEPDLFTFFGQTIKQELRTRSIKTKVVVLSCVIISVYVAKKFRFGTKDMLFETWVYLITLLFLTV